MGEKVEYDLASWKALLEDGGPSISGAKGFSFARWSVMEKGDHQGGLEIRREVLGIEDIESPSSRSPYLARPSHEIIDGCFWGESGAERD
jgi:hypothetical protein